MVSVAIEIAAEVAEIGEIAAEAADIATVAAEAADTASIVTEAIDVELTTTMETSLEATIGEDMSSVISDTVEEEISEELQQVIDESTDGTETGGSTDPADSTEGEAGKTKPSMLQIIKKWGNRILNTYMLMDIVGKQIMQIVDAATGKGGDGPAGQPQLTTQEKQDLKDFSTAIENMSLIYKSLHQSVKLISESTDFLGNEIVTMDGGVTVASVKQIFDSILTDIINVRNKLYMKLMQHYYSSSKVLLLLYTI